MVVTGGKAQRGGRAGAAPGCPLCLPWLGLPRGRAMVGRGGEDPVGGEKWGKVPGPVGRPPPLPSTHKDPDLGPLGLNNGLGLSWAWG